MKIGFISDIHEDVIRLKQAIDILKQKNCDKIICLGDIVGYTIPYYAFLKSRNSSEVIELIKQNCEISLIGNHDLFAIKKLPKYKAGFKYPRKWYSLNFDERKSLSGDKVYLYEENELSALLNKSDKKFLDKLPEYVVGDFDGIKILLSHYAFPDLAGNTTFEPKTSSDLVEHFEFMKKHGCLIGFSGHDHKEGIVKFTPGIVEEFGFGKIKVEKNVPTWLSLPCVVNGSFANGVTIFDTENFEVETIPIGSEKHVPPEWRKL